MKLRVLVGLVVVALSMLATHTNSIAFAQSAQDVCGRVRMAVSASTEIQYECYRPPNSTLSQGNYKECTDHPAETKCCPLNFSCTTPAPIPTVQCGDDTTYIKGTKQCSCGVESKLPNGQVCCGYFDPGDPTDQCKTYNTGSYTCGGTTTVIYGAQPAPSSCYCGGWFKTSSNITDGDTYCCGVQDPNNPTACNEAQTFSCGDKITYTGSGSPESLYACNCSGTSWFKNQEATAAPTYCCGYFSATAPFCAQTAGATPGPQPPTCGDTGTMDQCGAKGGCPEGQACNAWAWSRSCEPKDFCTDQPDPAPNPPAVTCAAPATCIANDRLCAENSGKVVSGTCASGSVCCDFTSSPNPPPGTGGDGGNGGDEGGGDSTKPPLNIFDGPTSADFAFLNPLKLFESPFVDDFSSPAGIINRIILFAFPLAGLILFVMIVWGGFEMVSGATSSKSMEAGRQRITAALIGFGLLFASFWIIQIVEYIFNIAIL